MSRTKISAALFCALFTASAATRADEVLFKNGDRLTGTIVTAEGGKLTIKTAVAGEIKVDLKDVQTFRTDQPIDLQLSDGSTIKDKVTPATRPGVVETAGTGTVQPPGAATTAPAPSQPVALADVKKINPPPVAWTGSIRAGGLLTRGNSDTDNLNIGADAIRRTDDDRTSVAAGYFFGREKVSGQPKETTTNNWFAQGKYDYFFAPKWYAYGLMRVEQDEIADLNLRLTPGVGVGYQWIEEPDFKLSTEGGLTWVYENYSNDGTNEHIAARLAYHVEKKINNRVALFHNLEYLPSVEDLNDFNINADAGMRVSLTQRMFSELKAEWRHDQTPAPGKAKDDVRYIMSLGWTF
jgi:putative salt-induced outer membrane protein YdiY